MQSFEITIPYEDFCGPLGYVYHVEVSGEGEAKAQVDRVPYGESTVELEGGTDFDYEIDSVKIKFSPGSSEQEGPDGPDVEKEFNLKEVPSLLMGIIQAAIEESLEGVE
jgi:hypothetical protein